MASYPDRHHPCYFLEDALRALGADAVVVRDGRTLGCWGLLVNGHVMVYLIDNRHEHERVKEDPAAAELIKRGALVCHAQKPDALRVGGKWLPLAVSPDYRLPDKPVEKLYDVGFVGYVRDAGRQSVLANVARHFKLHVAQGVFGDAAVSVYWQSKVGLNVVTGYGQPDSYDSWNMRAPEILATGTVLITPYEDYLTELGLVSGENCFMYRDANELNLLIETGMKAWYFQRGIGQAGAKLAQEKHTYAARARQVLEWLE